MFRAMRTARDLVTVMQGGAAVPYYLSGGVDPASIIAVWQPEGAADLASSYKNIANPGIKDIMLGIPPTWNVTDGWIFDGANQYLLTNIIPTGTYTVIVKGSNITDKVAVLLGLANVVAAGSTGNFKIFPRLSGGSYYQNAAQASFAHDRSSGVWAMAGKKPYYNGVYEGSDIPAGTLVAENRDIYIGAPNEGGYPGHSTQYLPCRIQALAIYNAVLSDPQIAAITTAMGAMPAQGAYTPTSSKAIKVVFQGDSITVRYCPLTSQALGLDWYNTVWHGTGGQTMATIATEGAAIDALYDDTFTKNIYVLMGGTNDLLNTAATGAEIYANIKGDCEARALAGYTVIAMCPPLSQPASRPADHDARWADLRALLNADHSFADGYVDFGADPNIGTATLTYYNVDLVHPKGTGLDIMAPLVVTAIQAV